MATNSGEISTTFWQYKLKSKNKTDRDKFSKQVNKRALRKTAREAGDDARDKSYLKRFYFCKHSNLGISSSNLKSAELQRDLSKYVTHNQSNNHSFIRQNLIFVAYKQLLEPNNFCRILPFLL